MKNSYPKPPAGLSTEAVGWWKRITTEFVFETPDTLLILEAAMRAFDRMEQARAAVDREGLVTVDRFGQLRPHPALLVERDSRTSMCRCLKQLGLDLETVPAGRAGRPAAGR